MSRLSWRVLRSEFVRGAGTTAAVAALALGVLAMYDLSGGWAGWPGRWMQFAVSVRMSLWVLGPIALAAGAWQAGREHRRRTGEQLASIPRPAWQQMTMAWASVTLGVWVALLAIVVAGVILVAPVATYSGGGWWWVLLLGFPGLGMMSALGVALGRLVPYRLVAVLAGVGTYLLSVGALDSGTPAGLGWLSPVLSQYEAVGHRLSGWVGWWQVWWFVGVTATILIALDARRRSLALVPAAVALVGGAALVAEVGSPAEGTSSAWSSAYWQQDRAALDLVCTDDGGPEVCLTRMDAYLLDDVVGPARARLARFDGLPHAPARAIPASWLVGDDRTSMDLRLYLDGGSTFTGELVEREEWLLVQWNPDVRCGREEELEPHTSAATAAAAWSMGEVPEWLDQPESGALLAMPEPDQREWMGRFLTAADSCDLDMLDDLAGELR